MGNTYRAIGERAKLIYGEGELVLDLSAADERDALDGKQLEIVPRRYRVLSSNFATAPQGETFEAAYPVEIEAALIAGGHITPDADWTLLDQDDDTELPPATDDTETADPDVPPTEDGDVPDPEEKGK